MAAPPDWLVEPSQLTRYGVPSTFLAQFAPLAFEVKISTGGALGTMGIVWRRRGETDWSAEILSAAGATWSTTIEDLFADVTFAAAVYVLNVVYTVDVAGVVSGGAGVTCSRFDLRDNACSAVTAEALTLMQNAIRQPLLTWGDDVRTHAAAWAFAILKRSRGATPPGAGLGDENVASAEAVARAFFIMIGEKGKPPSMTDSSPTLDGPLLQAYPISNTLRGW